MRHKIERYISKSLTFQALEIARSKASVVPLDYTGEVATGNYLKLNYLKI